MSTATFHVFMWDWGDYNNTPEEYGKSYFWEHFYVPPAKDTTRYWRDGRLVGWMMEIELPADHGDHDHDAEDFDGDAWCEVVWDACSKALNASMGRSSVVLEGLYDFEAVALPGPDVEVVA